MHWRTITFGLAIVGIILAILLPIKANKDAIDTGCHNLTDAIRQSQGNPRKFDKRGKPIPTPSEVFVGIITRNATPKELLTLKKATKAYPPLTKASCDKDGK